MTTWTCNWYLKWGQSCGIRHYQVDSFRTELNCRTLRELEIAPCGGNLYTFGDQSTEVYSVVMEEKQQDCFSFTQQLLETIDIQT